LYSRLPARLTAALVSSLLVASALGATPAFAEDAVEPTPTPSATEEASVEQAPSDEAVTDDEVEGQVEAAVPPAHNGTVTLAGSIAELVTESNAQGADVDHIVDGETGGSPYEGAPIQLFRITGFGFLSIDISGVDLSEAPDGIFDLEFEVPAGVDLGDSADSRYDALREYTLDVAPLKAIAYLPVKSSGDLARGFVNQTPASSAVHKIYALLVTPADVPLNSVSANQTVAKVQSTVAHSSDYWSAQTNGLVTFSLEGTVPWYKSAYNCKVGNDAEENAYNADHIWDEAADRAEAIGYRDGPNKHLVLFFPSSSDCVNAAGLAIAGGSLNSGGPAWVVGTDGVYEKSTLAHELGHNLSYGHANWADCSAQNPDPGLSGTIGCVEYEYGDIVDVMGGGGALGTGGNLSSPSAIRSGIWPTTDWTYTTPSTTASYTLNSVNSNAGLRSVVIEDNAGSNYFVEFRNQTGRDAQFNSTTCPWGSTSKACNSFTGVRILRAEHSYYGSLYGGYVKGRARDSSILIGHKVGSTKKGSFTLGETFSTAGISVTVTAVTSTTATVSVTTPAVTLTGSYVRVTRSSKSGASMAVGDQLNALVGSAFRANSYSFQWLRNNKPISGATKQVYTLTKADINTGIKIRLTGKVGSKSYTTTDPSSVYRGFGPIVAGVIQPGSVSVTTGDTALTAVPENWDTPSTKLSYQWLRNNKAISKATKVTYTPTSADNGKSLSVKVTGSRSGFNSASVTSAAKNYTVLVTGGAVTVSGTPKVGATLTSTHNLTFAKQEPAGPIASPVITRQWLRSGAAIPGATGSSYTLTSSDYGKVISLRVYGTTPGWSFGSQTSAVTGKVAKGTFTGTSAAPTVTATGLSLSAALTAGSVLEGDTKLTYQWYRGTAKIKKATKPTYTVTSADNAKTVFVRITVAKKNYITKVLDSVAKNYTVVPSSPTPVVVADAGGVKVGAVFSIQARTYAAGGLNVSPMLSYQWLRSGKAIASATSPTYTSGVLDKGKTISVKVTAAYANYLTSTTTSAATQKLGTNVLAGHSSTVSIAKTTGIITLTATGGVTEGGAKLSYQWLRAGKAITKATKITYTPVAADFNKVITVRITATKTNYTTVVATSPTGVNPSVVPGGVVTINNPVPIIGSTLTAQYPSYSPSPDGYTYQWYAAGKAIKSATNQTFVVTSAQNKKAITVRVIAAKAGLLSSALTSAATAKVTAS